MSFSYFDRVYVVSLPNVERRARMSEQLASLGVTPEYVYAEPPDRGFTMTNMRRNPSAEFGASLSHIKAIVHAIAHGVERPLFLEDDVEFADGAEVRLGVALQALPADWSVLYMGGHPRSPATMVSHALAKVGTFSFAESYALSRNALLKFFDFWCHRIGQPNAMFDIVLGEYAAAHGGYCVYPLLTHQPPGFSFIGGKVDDKRNLVRRGWANNLSTR